MGAAGFGKIVLQFNADFFQRLDAIGDKAGRDNRHFTSAIFGHVDDGFIGIGLQPLGRAEARLEGQFQLLFRQTELFAQ